MSKSGEETIKIFKKFSELYPEEFQKVVSLGTAGYAGFDPKTRELIISSILASQGYEREFKFHFGLLIKNGITRDELKSFLILLLVYLGVPRFLEVLKWCEDMEIF